MGMDEAAEVMDWAWMGLVGGKRCWDGYGRDGVNYEYL